MFPCHYACVSWGDVGLDGFCSPFFVCHIEASARQDMPSLAARGPYKASAACDSPIDLTVFEYADSGSMQWNLNDKDNRSRRHKRVGRPSRTSGRENGREGSGRRQARLAKEVGCTHHCTAASLISTNTGWTDMSTVEHVLADRSVGTRSQGRLL